MLQMKTACEKCNAELNPADGAFICSFECTFCPECTDSMVAVCPNCAGELRPRPRRRVVEEARS
jgi:hypothetical protein